MALSLFTGFRDPFLDDFERSMSRAMQPLFSLPRAEAASKAGQVTNWHPIDIEEHHDHYAIVADAPGMTPEDINVELKEKTLVVSGEKNSNKETTEEKAGARMHRRERTFSRFTRSFVLPDDTLTDAITATMENGVLTLHIPKKPQEPKRPETKRIRVMGGGTTAHSKGPSTPAANGSLTDKTAA